MTALPCLDDSDFDAGIGAGVVVVHFTASWCQPCALALPEVARLAIDLGRQARVVIADIDAAPHAANRADVRGVPSLVLFRDGSRVGNLIGHRPREKLRNWIDDNLKGEK